MNYGLNDLLFLQVPKHARNAREAVVSGAIFTWCELQPGVPLAYETIAKAAGLSVDTLERLVPAMLKGSYRGLIVRTRRRRGAPVYRTTAKLRALWRDWRFWKVLPGTGTPDEMVAVAILLDTPPDFAIDFHRFKKVWRAAFPGRAVARERGLELRFQKALAATGIGIRRPAEPIPNATNAASNHGQKCAVKAPTSWTELRTPPDIHQETEEPQKIRSDLQKTNTIPPERDSVFGSQSDSGTSANNQGLPATPELVGEILDGLKHWKFAREPILDPRNAFDVFCQVYPRVAECDYSGLRAVWYRDIYPLLKAYPWLTLRLLVHAKKAYEFGPIDFVPYATTYLLNRRFLDELNLIGSWGKPLDWEKHHPAWWCALVDEFAAGLWETEVGRDPRAHDTGREFPDYTECDDTPAECRCQFHSDQRERQRAAYASRLYREIEIGVSGERKTRA